MTSTTSAIAVMSTQALLDEGGTHQYESNYKKSSCIQPELLPWHS